MLVEVLLLPEMLVPVLVLVEAEPAEVDVDAEPDVEPEPLVLVLVLVMCEIDEVWTVLTDDGGGTALLEPDGSPAARVTGVWSRPTQYNRRSF